LKIESNGEMYIAGETTTKFNLKNNKFGIRLPRKIEKDPYIIF